MTNSPTASRPAALDRAVAAYRSRYGGEPDLVVRAPGRVNLIGEHTDYNDGFVLPMALPFDVVIAGSPVADPRVEAASEGFEPIEFDLAGPVSLGSWSAYVHGTAHMLTDAGHPVGGWQGCLASDIPTGASLSSSAALEVAAGLAFVTSAGARIAATELAKIGQRVENEVLGLPSGIMDQLASAASVDGAASLIDCRDLSLSAVPLPSGVQIVIMDTGTRRELVDSQYAARRADCEAAAEALGVLALRDAGMEQLDEIADDRVQRRARHVVGENSRTLEAAQAMHDADIDRLGHLMNASHHSLSRDYDVSSPALDAIVELAQSITGCRGARMTGGGFAGAAVALVDDGAIDAFIEQVTARFVAPPEQPSTEPVRLYAVLPAAGASVITAPR